jgi:cleavage stimulation factor subunit 3
MQGRLDEAGAYLKTGVDANPRRLVEKLNISRCLSPDFACSPSFLLTFAYAEHEESKKNNAAAHAAYERLIAEHGASIDKLKVSIEKEVEQAKGPEIPVDENEEDIEMVGAGPSETRKKQMERDARGQAVRDRRAVEVEDLTTAAGVIWVMYMRFVRRAEVGSKQAGRGLANSC